MGSENKNPPNLLTIDIEEWAESSLFLLSEQEAARAGQFITGQDQQVERGTRLFLELLSAHKAGATFFVMGQTARNHKALVAAIRDQGHEIASHSMTHTLLNRLSPAQLKYELEASKKLLEDLSGKPVLGFRAPSLITWEDRASFFNQLRDAGYVYDSSICRGPGHEGGDLLEIPISYPRWFCVRIPLGGSYFKLFGTDQLSAAIEAENRASHPANIYLHPYELDPSPMTWPHPDPSLKARLATAVRNAGKGRNLDNVKHALERHKFVSIRDYLEASGRIPGNR
jgi:peptidoglycan/xylan/chitin deacetylase (PgdA/CDA1 family)